MSERHREMLNPNFMPMLENNGRLFIQLKPFVDCIGLDWEKERDKIKMDKLLSGGFYDVLAIDGDKKVRVCGIAAPELLVWIFRFNPNDYEDKIKAEIIEFQELFLEFITKVIRHNDEEPDYE